MRIIAFLNIVTICALGGCGDNYSENTSLRSGDPAPKTGDAHRREKEAFAIIYESMANLGDCNLEHNNKLAFIRSENAFYICSENQWHKIDLAGIPGPQGKAGASGEKGEKGDAGAAGSSGEDGTNTLFRVTPDSLREGCLLGGKKIEVGLDNGDQGALANSGTLEDGEVDEIAYICQVGEGVFDSNDQFLGTVLPIKQNSSVLINLMLPGNGFGLFDITTGKYKNTWGLIVGEMREMGCYFLTIDCTGACYAADMQADINTVPIKNALFYNGIEFFRAGDNFAAAGTQNFLSTYTDTCIEITETRNHSYPIETKFDLPDNIVMPLSAPLYFERID